MWIILCWLKLTFGYAVNRIFFDGHNTNSASNSIVLLTTILTYEKFSELLKYIFFEFQMPNVLLGVVSMIQPFKGT